jgi:glutathione S-transferase
MVEEEGTAEEKDFDFAYGQMTTKVKILNDYLEGKTWLAGDKMTVADIRLTLVQLSLQTAVMNQNLRDSLPHLSKHFNMVC